jgi:hypothetical protein
MAKTLGPRLVMRSVSHQTTTNKSIDGRPQELQTSGPECVWHCHTLAHIEHDMMQPVVVL